MIKKLGPAEDGRMWRKETRQRSFAEQSIVGGSGCNARLKGIAELLDWGALAGCGKTMSFPFSGI